MSSSAKPSENFFEKALKRDLERRKHRVYVLIRGCDTYLICYCTVTHGRDHHEGDFPRVMKDGTYDRGGGPERPLTHPLRPDEDPGEYRTRMACGKAWTEGLSAGMRLGTDAVNPYLKTGG